MRYTVAMFVGITALCCAPPPPALAGPASPAVRELTERRTMNTRTFLLANGANRVEVHGRPIHYKAQDGTWQPIDTTLAATSKAGFSRANERNVLRSYMPGGTDGWVRAESDKGAVSFRPLGAASLSTAAGAKSAGWSRLWRNTDLNLAPTPGGLKETITLASADVPASFRFGIRTEGLTTRLNADNSVSLLDAGGNPSLMIAQPWMQDAAGKRSYAVAVALQDTVQGTVYTMTPDPAWLAAAAYPVTIDPTITAYVSEPIWCGTGAGAIGHQYDDRVMRDSCGYGDPVYPDGMPEVLIGPDPLYPGSVCEAIEVFGANLDSIGIPPNASISSASFRLVVDCDGDEGGDTITVADAPFIPGAPVTWISIDAAYNSDTLHPSTTATAQTYPETEFDITSIVQYWVTKQTSPLGIRLRADTASNPIYAHAYADDALEITYASAGTVYGAGPGITAGIFYNNDSVAPGGQIEAWLTDGVDGYGWAMDTRHKYIDGAAAGTASDELAQVVWSVPTIGGMAIGTLGKPGETPSGTTLSTNDADSKFSVVWYVPANAPLGTYGLSAKVYDAGLGNPVSQNSVEPSPFSTTKSVDVGVVSYSNFPPITAAIGAPSYIDSTSPGQVSLGGTVYLIPRSGPQNNAAYDLDTKYLARDANGTDKIAFPTVPDQIGSVEWHVTDNQGQSVGTLALVSGTTYSWTAPTTPMCCWVTMTIDDIAVNGTEFDDKPLTVSAPIRVGTGQTTTPRLNDHDTSEELSAVNIARNFCASIGSPQLGAASAHYPALADFDGAHPKYLLPRWSVIFDSGTEVDVVDSTSAIARYFSAYATGHLENAGSPLTDPYTAGDASLYGSRVLNKAAANIQIGDATVAADDPGAEEDSGSGPVWIVMFPRQFTDPQTGPVLYRDQGASVVLLNKEPGSPSTGVPAVLTYTANCTTAEPTAALRSITEEAAAAAAAEQLAASAIADASLQDAELVVVEPNTFWINQNSEASGSAPKVAWDCVYTTEDGNAFEVWVNPSSDYFNTGSPAYHDRIAANPIIGGSFSQLSQAERTSDIRKGRRASSSRRPRTSHPGIVSIKRPLRGAHRAGVHKAKTTKPIAQTTPHSSNGVNAPPSPGRAKPTNARPKRGRDEFSNQARTKKEEVR